MSEELDPESKPKETPKPPEEIPKEVPTEIPEEIMQKAIDDKLKDIKDKLDKAYGERDQALKVLADKELAEREANIIKLQEEGRHKEVYELQLAQEKAKSEALAKRVTELSRDSEVKTYLSGYVFRSETATSMAFKEIVGNLVQNEQDQWVHKTGKSISDHIKDFFNDDANVFLLKPKVNSGAGTTTTAPTSEPPSNASLFSMSQEEVLKRAAEGKLRRK
jgi:hypothetical protein